MDILLSSYLSLIFSHICDIPLDASMSEIFDLDLSFMFIFHV